MPFSDTNTNSRPNLYSEQNFIQDIIGACDYIEHNEIQMPTVRCCFFSNTHPFKNIKQSIQCIQESTEENSDALWQLIYQLNQVKINQFSIIVKAFIKQFFSCNPEKKQFYIDYYDRQCQYDDIDDEYAYCNFVIQM